MGAILLNFNYPFGQPFLFPPTDNFKLNAQISASFSRRVSTAEWY